MPTNPKAGPFPALYNTRHKQRYGKSRFEPCRKSKLSPRLFSEVVDKAIEEICRREDAERRKKNAVEIR